MEQKNEPACQVEQLITQNDTLRFKYHLISASIPLSGFALGWLGTKGYEFISGNDVQTSEEIIAPLCFAAFTPLVYAMHVLKRLRNNATNN